MDVVLDLLEFMETHRRSLYAPLISLIKFLPNQTVLDPSLDTGAKFRRLRRCLRLNTNYTRRRQIARSTMQIERRTADRVVIAPTTIYNNDRGMRVRIVERLNRRDDGGQPLNS